MKCLIKLALKFCSQMHHLLHKIFRRKNHQRKCRSKEENYNCSIVDFRAQFTSENRDYFCVNLSILNLEFI